jgi:RNA polymerase sigma-70 factor, ECF subfamily
MEFPALPPRGAIVHSIGSCSFAEESAPVARHDRTARPGASSAPRVAPRTTVPPGSPYNGGKSGADIGREHAFSTLFQAETIRRVHRWLGKLRVPERDRHDLSQEVFLAAWTSFGRHDPARGSVARWLNGIAVNLAAHYHAKASHRREVITDPEELREAGGSATALDHLLAEERRNVLRALVLELPFELRSVLVQRDLFEIPMKEIAETRAIPLSTTYKWRTRALHGGRGALARRLAAE